MLVIWNSRLIETVEPMHSTWPDEVIWHLVETWVQLRVRCMLTVWIKWSMPDGLFFSCNSLCTCVLRMSGTHKTVVVSLETTFSPIKRWDNKESIKIAATDLEQEVTVSDWKRKRNEMEKWVNQIINGISCLTRKTEGNGIWTHSQDIVCLVLSTTRD